MYAPTLKWLDELEPIDPLLKEPLNLHGQAARRRIQGQALMRAMGFGNRLDASPLEHPPMADTTCRLFFWMLDGLAEMRAERPGSIPESAERIANGYGPDGPFAIPRLDATQALIDLGLGHTTIMHGGTAREVLEFFRDSYCNQMTERLVTMLRRWQKAGWIEGD